MDDLVGAVRKLRFHLGDSQQAFATRLGLSISAIANYERDRKPTGKALVQLMKAADTQGLAELATVFQDALSKELGHDVMRIAAPKINVPVGQEEDFAALFTMLNLGGKQNKEALTEWKRISEPVKAVNRAKDYRASTQVGLLRTIEKHLDAGLTDEEIIARVSQATPEWIEAARHILAPKKMGGKK